MGSDDDWSSVLSHLDHTKPFEATCDALHVQVEYTLSHKEDLIMLISEKFNKTRTCFSTYDEQFDAVEGLRCGMCSFCTLIIRYKISSNCEIMCQIC